MKILTTPNTFLRKVAKNVSKLSTKDLVEISQMIQTLNNTHDPEGVGLAATQVGVDKQIFILILKRKPIVFINPQIIKKSEKMFSNVYKKQKDRWMEGCLSIPKLWGFVDRPFEVTLQYQTISDKLDDPSISKPQSQQKTFKDIESAYVQHEADHLNGVLFTDHILKQKGELFKEVDGELEPVEL